MSHNITIEGGSSVRLPTAGKYCDRDIVVTSTGGKEDLDAVLTAQEEKIAELSLILDSKAAGDELDVETYEGAYEVTPKVSGQVLPTMSKYMKKDVTVNAIPYFNVGNTSGGSTVYIGSEV